MLQANCLTIILGIWKNRCKLIYQATSTHPSVIASRAEIVALEFFKESVHSNRHESGMFSNDTLHSNTPIPTPPALTITL